jgi:hypothetical protein
MGKDGPRQARHDKERRARCGYGNRQRGNREREEKRREKTDGCCTSCGSKGGGGGKYRVREPAVRAEKKARPIGACAM